MFAYVKFKFSLPEIFLLYSKSYSLNLDSLIFHGIQSMAITLPEHYFTSWMALKYPFFVLTQPAFTCLKLAIETLEQGVEYFQS